MEKIEWVYESPDNGMTIYRRKMGSLVREVVKEAGPVLKCPVCGNKICKEIKKAKVTG